MKCSAYILRYVLVTVKAVLTAMLRLAVACLTMASIFMLVPLTSALLFAAPNPIPATCASKDGFDPLDPNALTYEELKRIIQQPDNRISSVNDLLRFFARHPVYRGFLENPVLNDKSFALHRADVGPSFPRLVIHQHRMIIMMVTDPSKTSSDELEIQEYIPAAHKFMFRIVNFAAKGTPEMFVDDAGTTPISFLGHDGKAVFIPPFTRKYSGTIGSCNSCHDRGGSFEPYHANADLLPRWNVPSLWKQPFPETIEAGSEQAANWELFQQTLKDPSLPSAFAFAPQSKRPSRIQAG